MSKNNNQKTVTGSQSKNNITHSEINRCHLNYTNVSVQNFTSQHRPDFNTSSIITESDKQGHWQESNLITLAHHNIQGIKNKVPEIIEFLLSFQVDILCLTEHFLKGESCKNLAIPGYELGSIYCREISEKGGSSIYVKQHLKYEPIEEFSVISKECILECSSLKLVDLKTIILCIYHPPSNKFTTLSRHKKEFILCLRDILDIIIQKYETKYKIIICGDFNHDLQKENDKYVKTFIETLSEYNFNPQIHSPTRITNGTATVIDNIFVNFNICTAFVIGSALSDHTAQILKYDANYTKLESYYVQRRNLGIKELDQLNIELNTLSWETIFLGDIEYCTNTFIRTLVSLMNTICPVKTKKIITNTKHKWLTPSIKAKCKEKRILWKKYIEGLVTKDEFRKFCKDLKQEIQ